MRKELVALAAFLVLVPSAVGLPGVARFREVEVTHRSSGLVEAWRTKVLLLRQAKSVGTGAIVCVNVDAHTSIRECQGTYVLPQGRIQVAGEIVNRAAYQLTIVGGTGVYTAAGGTAIFRTGFATFLLEG